MTSANIFRIGGIAAILSIVLSFGAFVLPALLPFAALLLAVFVFALYRWFSLFAPAMSLTAAVVGIAGAVIFASMLFINGSVNAAPQNIAIWAAWFVPPLAFGYLSMRHHEAGMSRVLGIIGIVAGVFGLLNLLLTLAGGGNWEQPNDPALAPWILGAYWLAQLPSLVWMLWSGIALMRLKPALRQQLT
jgi:hypothetical protein